MYQKAFQAARLERRLSARVVTFIGSLPGHRPDLRRLHRGFGTMHFRRPGLSVFPRHRHSRPGKKKSPAWMTELDRHAG